MNILLKLKNIRKVRTGLSSSKSDGTIDTMIPLYSVSYDNGDGNFRLKVDLTAEDKSFIPKELTISKTKTDKDTYAIDQIEKIYLACHNDNGDFDKDEFEKNLFKLKESIVGYVE